MALCDFDVQKAGFPIQLDSDRDTSMTPVGRHAPEQYCKAWHEYGRNVHRPDHGSMAAEVDDFPIGYIERVISARVPALPYSYGVTPGIKRCRDRLMVHERADGLGVNRDLEPAASELDAESNVARHPERC
jgi:hypothetical protein